MKKLIDILIEKKMFVFIIMAIIILAGIIAYKNLKIDVFPDPSPVLIQVFTHAEGMAPEEVEKFVSYPIETSLYGLPRVKKINSLSTFGLSTINVYFDDAVDIYFARQLVSQQLIGIQEKLPDFVDAPELGPISTGLGMVYVYAVKEVRTAGRSTHVNEETQGNSILELRTLQDWVIKFQLQSVPGIAAVKSHGGDVKQFHVVVAPDRLLKYELSLHEVIESIKKSSKNITAGYIIRNKEEYIVRGLGLFEEIAALKKVALKESQATPIFLEDVADITIGSAVKRGEALLDQDGPVVSGIVMKLIGVNTAELIEKIDKRVAEINAGMPKNIRLTPVYNQALIIKAAFATVAQALILSIILVVIIIFIFIDDLSSAFVTALAIPFAVCIAFIAMKALDMTADLMSFGGLAIGIGLLVDAAVVVVENIYRNRQRAAPAAQQVSGTLIPGSHDKKNVFFRTLTHDINKNTNNDKEIIHLSLSEVLRPLVYTMALIILVFIPILTLQDIEGKLFKPFGFTLLVAIIAAIIYAIFFTPVLMNACHRPAAITRKKMAPQAQDKSPVALKKIISPGFIFDPIKRTYLKIFDFFYKREVLTIGVFSLVFLFGVGIFIATGSEFIPALNERSIQVQLTLPQNTSLDETVYMLQAVHKELAHFPEIGTVYGRVGEGEAGTHAHPVNTAKTILTLKHKKYWQAANEAELIEKMREKIKHKMPGVNLSFTQPIQHNLDHLVTGVRADLAIKVFGDDYDKLAELAENIGRIISTVQGVEDIYVSKAAGLNEIAIRLNRGNLARYGIDPEALLDELEAAVGGKTVTKIYQGDVAYDVFLRYSSKSRASIEDLNHFFIYPGKGRMLPLSAVADIRETTGFSEINRENGKRFITVQCNVHGRDIGGIVSETKEKIYGSKRIVLPFGYYLEWGGQFELKEKSEKRLSIVLFITFFLILALLFDFLKTWKDIFVILVNIPVSLSGGILALWLSGAYISVPAVIGFIALLGIALENNLILISFFKLKTREIGDFDEAVRESVGVRLRPVLMTQFTTIIGLFPLLFSTGIGSEMQRPLVIVVIGGIVFSIFTTLVLMPVVYKKVFKKV